MVENNVPSKDSGYEEILVFKNVDLEDLMNQKKIDPHFSENKKYFSPIARFTPTEEGWNLAVVLCKYVGNIKEEEKINNNIIINSTKKIYTNGIMLAPDGEKLCMIGKSKVDWYLKRGLADLIAEDPPTIKLKFEPKGRGHKDDPFYLEEKTDCCVVTGEKKGLTKHHIVPQCFRRFFPDSYKNHSYHDVLLVTREVHNQYEKEADKLKQELSEKYDAPLQGSGFTVDKDLKKVCSAARALSKPEKINKSKRKKLIAILKDHFQKDTITHEDIQKATGIAYRIKSDEFVEYGKKIVNSVPSLEEFVIMWRKHFIEKMNPKHMPKYWDVNRKIDVG